MTKIAILCPTRGRPEQFLRMHRSVDYTQSTGVKVFGMIADNDPTDYSKVIEFDPSLKVPDWTTVMSWNHAAKMIYDQQPDVKLFMLGADDMTFSTPGWDVALIKSYEELKEKVHVWAFRDSRDENGTPHIVVSREWIDAMGYFVCPIFLHWYIDTWTVAVAKANGVFTHLKDYLLTHDKPSDTGAGDETHNRIRRNGWHERDAYVAKTCDHFLKMEMVRLDNYLRKREAA